MLINMSIFIPTLNALIDQFKFYEIDLIVLEKSWNEVLLQNFGQRLLRQILF